MKIIFFNKSFPDNTEYNRVINDADPSFVPRIGDQVYIGYYPVPIVTNVVWFYDKNEVVVAVK